jgi:hypothetical protein
VKQEEARRRARELGGIAVSARQRFDSGGAPAGWQLGGWPGQKGETWIVVSPPPRRRRDLPQRVLDDTRTPGDEILDGRYVEGTG